MAAPDDVHIVVPTRAERLELLDISVRSLLAQTHPVRVTIVAADASVDLLTRRFADQPNLTITAERQPGLSAAINQAWRDDRWSSAFTGWLGDDDALPPDSVRCALAELKAHPNATMVHGQCLFVDADGDPLWVARNGRLAALFVGYGINLIAQPGCLFRTSSVQQVNGLDEGLKYAMDVDLYVRLRRVGAIATCSRQLGVFRAHEVGLSTGGATAALAEAKLVQRRAHLGIAERLLNTIAIPLTRLTGLTTRHFGRSASGYWRPYD